MFKKLFLSTLFFLFLFFNLSAQEDAGAEILWDTWGVPHIYANNNEDLFYAFGYAQMHNHADLILSLYANVRGEQASYWGEDFIQDDVLIHTLGVPQMGQTIYDDQNAEFKAMNDAFVAGMNAYAEAHPDAISEQLQVVLPVRNTDPLTLAYNNVVVVFVGGGAFGLVEQFQAGSNAWAIAPERSASGNTLMILNPHLQWSGVFVWFEAHLNGPDANLYGATLVGLPGIEIGFNEYLGWTHTVNTYDGFDVYRLSLTESGGYMLDGEEATFDVREQTINVMQADGTMGEFAFPVLESEHGPVIAQEGSEALAFRVVQDSTYMMEQWWQMATATNLEEFEGAMSRVQIPMFNTVYGDRDGNIYYLFNGQVPVRDSGDFTSWLGIQDGADSSLIWTDLHPYEDLPKVINPPSGFVQNANEPPWTSTNPPELAIESYPPYVAPQSSIRLGIFSVRRFHHRLLSRMSPSPLKNWSNISTTHTLKQQIMCWMT